jgi:HSP20 family protein
MKRKNFRDISPYKEHPTNEMDFLRERSRRDPFFNSFDMEPFFDDFFDVNFRDLRKDFNNMVLPESDYWEDEKNIYVDVNIPGVEKKDIIIEIKGDVLEIKAKSSFELDEHDENQRIHRIERRYSGFCRSFELPEYANKEKIDAQYKNGVLKIVIPKDESSKSNTKRIEVK